MSLPNAKTQLIFDDYTFNKDVKETVKKWDGFASSGINYHFVGILGPQSSGKSTLLNLLFNCDYVVMEESGGRSQTTRGMWLSYDSDKKIVIMDVEGTDSVERGEGHVNFERKSSLFSLAMSEVLIINNNYMDIGRYSASNYDTLKTIFDIHLRLFHRPGSPKTKLLFILRDVKHLSAMDKISIDLTQNIMKLWQSIEVPETVEKLSLESYFTLEFVGLPHYHYEQQLFTQETTALATRFKDRAAGNYIFKDEYKKQVPAEGFSDYAEQIWAKIIQNKDLDLPSIQEMLSTLRCSEIYKEAILPLQTQCDEVTQVLMQKHIIQDLGSKFILAQKSAISDYQERAALYQRSVYEAKLAELVHDSERLFSPLKIMQIENISHVALKEGRSVITKEIGELMEIVDPGFWPKAATTLEKLLDRLQGEIRGHLFISLLDTSDEKVGHEIELIMHDIKPQVVDCIKERISDQNLVLRMMKKTFDKAFKYENNVPREWTSSDNIKDVFAKACAESYKILNILSQACLGEENIFPLLSEVDIERLRQRFNEDVYGSYQDAILSQKKSFNLHGIPPYMFFIVALLGFNEFLSFLRWITSPLNAILFVFMALVSMGVYAMHNLGLLAPIQTVAIEMGHGHLRELKAMVATFFSDDHPQQGTTTSNLQDHFKRE